jgi:hypothetical protein
MELSTTERTDSRQSSHLRKLVSYEATLVLIFVFTLPLCNPWVRGDGVGYYAFARSMLIERRLDFTKDWLSANESFRMGRTDPNGRILPDQYTPTGHLNNHFSVGPAILWSPFLIVAHTGVLLCRHFGGKVAADGFSKPYLVAMALGTAFYGFLALLISFGLARRYVPERWAFLATLGIWFGSSLPVYMYFNPSWSHAQAAFAVALFFWYWVRTRDHRTWMQWVILGALGGLMMDVYYINAVLLLIPLCESVGFVWSALRNKFLQPLGPFLLKNLAFCAALSLAFLPTLIAKKIIYGSYATLGYEHLWVWNSPALLKVCFSPDHGLFSWTPILIPAVAGFFFLRRYDWNLGAYAIGVFVALLYTMGCYADWDGLSSFGNRFFVSLTVLFVLGLAAFIDWFVRAWHSPRATVMATSSVAVLVLWNLGLIFQWGMHLIPVRGPIFWREAAYNQVAVVPAEATSALKNYMTRRKGLMDLIEQRDVDQLKSQGPQGAK